jgi:hypothetical protein
MPLSPARKGHSNEPKKLAVFFNGSLSAAWYTVDLIEAGNRLEALPNPHLDFISNGASPHGHGMSVRIPLDKQKKALGGEFGNASATKGE